MADWRLAIDIGGTFTDSVLLDAASGRVVTDKTLTTPSAPLRGLQQGVERLLERAGVAPTEVDTPVVHATTLVTNALIEGKGARAALLTTRGFADTMLIRNEHRYDMYDLQIEFGEPPIPRQLTFEVTERTTAGGQVLTAPDRAEVVAIGRRLREAGVEAVAICFLHSYANPANERAVAAWLAEYLRVPICCSSEVAPQIREYPRMVTTACNAISMPLVGAYLDHLQAWLQKRRFRGGLLVMLSSGGVAAPDVAARNPIRLVESGPAAGALAGAWYARRLGARRMLCFDMGGTTAKACLVEDFEPALSSDFEVARVYRFKKGSGYPISVPSIDLVEIGAGGGSVARVDALGLLKVGPESAGAEPGPACYARGGQRPTVTDADVVLGYIDPGYFLGGDMRLDFHAAHQAIEDLAGHLNLSVADAAYGIHEVVNQNMAASARMHGIERGVDLRGVTVLAFGGAGPVHACGVAEILEAERIVFPAEASVLSAFGTLVSPVRLDLVRTLVRRLDGVDGRERDRVLAEMRKEALDALQSAGTRLDEVTIRYGVDARYQGQGHEITVWVGEGETWPIDAAGLRQRYEDEYRRVYSLTIPELPIEIVSWRLSAFASAPYLGLTTPPPGGQVKRKAERSVLFDRECGFEVVPVYERRALPAGAELSGPCIVEQRDTTTVLRPGWRAVVSPDGSLIATRDLGRITVETHLAESSFPVS